MLRQTQQQKLLQKLSPQQIQLMKLLQVPTANLEERIKEELESNPALEEGADEIYQDEYSFDDNHDDFESQDTGSDDDLVDISDYLLSESDSTSDYHVNENGDDDDEPKTIPIKYENTFHDHLLEQLGMLNLSEQQEIIARQIIGSIDDDGYLRRDTLSISDDLAFKLNVIASEDDVNEMLHLIQDFDPIGVGASDLQECLLLQLKKLSKDSKPVKDAITIIEKFFEEFTKKHYDKIKARNKFSEEDFKNAINIILKLTPKPGSSFSTGSKDSGYIIPDFFVYSNNGKLELSLNARNAPELRISEGYKDMLKTYDIAQKKDKRQREALQFIKQKMDAAKWFIDAIKQRQHTLLITMNAILNYQYAFFLSGDESDLKPMILKDIADKINMDVSTVSRVANSKYVQTEYGTYLLKYFFSEAMVTDSGEEVSSREIKTVLEQLVAEEDKQKPLSDEKLMDLLNAKGYNVARRTVAKYREQLEIPVARMRKMA